MKWCAATRWAESLDEIKQLRRRAVRTLKRQKGVAPIRRNSSPGASSTPRALAARHNLLTELPEGSRAHRNMPAAGRWQDSRACFKELLHCCCAAPSGAAATPGGGDSVRGQHVQNNFLASSLEASARAVLARAVAR